MNAPSSYPNSSLSSILSGKAAQLTATKGPRRRLLALWMLWAKSSLPVPVSPVISTVDSVDANLCALVITSSMLSSVEIRSLNACFATWPLRYSSRLTSCSTFWIRVTSWKVTTTPTMSSRTMMGIRLVIMTFSPTRWIISSSDFPLNLTLSRSSFGESSLTCLPSASLALMPRSLSATGLKTVMTPSLSMATIPSCAKSTIAFSSSAFCRSRA